MLYDNNTIDTYDFDDDDFDDDDFDDEYKEKCVDTILCAHKIVSMSAVSSSNIILMLENNVIIDLAHYCNTNDNHKSHKAISMSNFPYCANFNAETIPYYPKYFMDRFIAFVMSVKYSHNIRLPKYLYFMVANNLK